MLKLRDYQTTANRKIRGSESRNPTCRVVVQGPCGSGKSIQIADLLTDPIPQLLVTHRRILFEQLHQTMTTLGVPHGLRAAGYGADRSQPVQLCMLQTENARAGRMPEFAGCRRIIIDELHAVKGKTTESLINRFGSDASVVGFTATPAELGHLVEECIVSSTVPDLVEMGYLVPFETYGPTTPDMEALTAVRRQASGEYSPSALEKVFPVKAIFGRVVDHYHKLNPDRRPTILFAPGVPQSLWFAQHLTGCGIKAAHIDCKGIWVDGDYQEYNVENLGVLRDRMEKGDIRVICNRYILREGVDWTFLKCAILATAFGTRTAFVQSVGRILRPHPGQNKALIIDHGGNWLQHPPLSSPVSWDWQTLQRIQAGIRADRLRDGDLPEPICCPECSAIRESGPECPHCGYRHRISARWVLQIRGGLRRIKGRAYRPRKVYRKPHQAETWKRKLYGNRKHKPGRTCNQIYANMAREDNWCWPPRDLPGMPRTRRGWYMPVGELRACDVYGGSDFF